MKTIDDLRPHAERALEDAYNRRERRQMSREDFSSGFVAALEWLRSSSSFLPSSGSESEKS